MYNQMAFMAENISQWIKNGDAIMFIVAVFMTSFNIRQTLHFCALVGLQKQRKLWNIARFDGHKKNNMNGCMWTILLN